MRSSTYGIFLLVHNGIKKKSWRDKRLMKTISFQQLIDVLTQEAINLSRKYSNVTDIGVVGIDFTIR
jgi:hypothetical protein